MPDGITTPTSEDEAPDWWSRKSVWKVPLILLAVVLFGGGIFWTAIGFIKKCGAYTGALDRARASTQVCEALGTPIEDGLLVTGNIRVSGPSGWASLAIPIHGPKGRGVIYVEAPKELGEWRFKHLIVGIEATRERIDLSDAAGKRAL